MTTIAQRRCLACNVRYHWQSSGPGCDDPDNSADYCEDCAAIVRRVLVSIPVRVIKQWVPTDDVTAFELEQLEKDNAATALAEGKLHVRRVVAPFFDLEDPNNIQHCGFTKKDGKLYRWSYWSKDPEGTAKVQLAIERNMETGETCVWVDLPRR